MAGKDQRDIQRFYRTSKRELNNSKERIVRQEQFCARVHYCKTVGRKRRRIEEADN